MNFLQEGDKGGEFDVFEQVRTIDHVDGVFGQRDAGPKIVIDVRAANVDGRPAILAPHGPRSQVQPDRV